MSDSPQRRSIAERAKAFQGGKPPYQPRRGSGDNAIDAMISPGVKPRRKTTAEGTEKVRSLDLNDSSGSLHESFDSMRFEREREEILFHRSGTVNLIVDKYNEQIQANIEYCKKELEEKEARKQRYRSRAKRPRNNKKRRNTKSRLVSESVWNNKMAKASFKVDPKTFKAPKLLHRPSRAQEEVLQQAIADNVLIRHDKRPNKTLIQAFEPVELSKGEKIDNENEKYFYVVEDGRVDIEQNGKVVAEVGKGDTFGDMNLAYTDEVGRNKTQSKEGKSLTLVAKEGAKVLRLKQDDFRGIVQSQAKQEELDKQELLKNLPFMNKLLTARDGNKKKSKEYVSDVIDRITSIMRPVYFEPGDQLHKEDDDTLYVLKEGNVKLTSVKDQQFVLGPGDYIGRKALMGTRGKEPEVKGMEALSSGIAYAVDKKVAEKVLGMNYVNRQTSRLDDSKKLDAFQCIKSVKLDSDTLDTLAESVNDKAFKDGERIMKQGEQVEPCLYLVREGQVTLSSDDGSFSRDVGAGGYFGVEKLLVPKNAPNDKAKPSKDMKLPAQWNVTVSGGKPCVVGVLSLVDSQEILDNDGKIKEKPIVQKPESQMVVKRKQTSKIVQNSVKMEDLEFINVLGDGAFGEVWLVQTDVQEKKEQFALKKILKEKEFVDALHREISFLNKFGFRHPFIINLIKVFDEEDCMYMLMSLASGGELWDTIHREESDGTWTSGISEKQARFYAFLIADTLAYIHSKKYVYRDLKPENVLIDSDGYPILIDFGFAKHCPEKTYTCCGTPNYVAPEIITNEGHNQAVDWWALGVLIYEMVSGEHPFYVDGMDQMAVFESITMEDYSPIPCKVSNEVMDLVDHFLEKEPTERLGMLAGREQDIMTHPWFEGLDLATLRSRKTKAPYIPPSKKKSP